MPLGMNVRTENKPTKFVYCTSPLAQAGGIDLNFSAVHRHGQFYQF